jgi:hypothetical protein
MEKHQKYISRADPSRKAEEILHFRQNESEGEMAQKGILLIVYNALHTEVIFFL